LGFIVGVRGTIQEDQATHQVERTRAAGGKTTLQPKHDAMSCSSMWLACIPQEVTNDQLVRVVVKYLTDHPEQKNYTIVQVAYLAFKNTYPCKQP
jgi:hypothetical protein